MTKTMAVDRESRSDHGDQFTRLLMEHQRRLYGYIYSLVHNRAIAEDLMQEISVTLWKKFEDFEEGTNFLAWSLTIARFHVLNWRRRQKRLMLSLDEQQFGVLAETAERHAHQQNERYKALEVCINKLSDRHKEILRQRYELDESVVAIASRREQSPRTIYKALTRIHHLLLECIQRQLAYT